MQTDQWKYILQSGEEILWQGRPDATLSFQIRDPALFGMGLFFAGFSIFWMFTALQEGDPVGIFSLFFLCAGLGVSIAPPFVQSYTRARTWYTLTNRRAYIATRLPWKPKDLRSWSITAENALDYQPGAPGSVFFTTELRRGSKRSYKVDIGFERIYDASIVYEMMRSLQDQPEHTSVSDPDAITLNSPNGTHP